MSSAEVRLGIEIYIAMDRLGHPVDSDVVTDLAIQLIENGWVKNEMVQKITLTMPASMSLEGSQEAAMKAAETYEREFPQPEVASDNGDGPPDPDFRKRYYPSSRAREQAPATTRTPKPSGVQWGTEYVDPNNVEPPKDFIEKTWSGWALNANQTAIIKMMTGDKGRYSLGIQTITNYLKKYGKVKPGQDPAARKHLKPHHLTNSLIRRGLVMEIADDVFILSPRGTVFVRNHLGVEPTPRHDSVSSVAE